MNAARSVPLLLAVALLGCGGAEEASKPDSVPAPTVALTLPPTSEQILADEPNPEEVDPDEEVEPTPPTEPTPTTLATGLPRGLGIPGAGQISLGGGSSISNGFTVREVPFLEVVVFVQSELQADGWQVQPLPVGADSVAAFRFVGPGAVGQAEVEPVPDGTVHVQVVLQGG